MAIFVRIKYVAMRTVFSIIAGFSILCLFSQACGSTANLPETNEVDNQVNVGFGTTDKDDLTYSVSSVKMDDQHSYPNMYEYLKGRVPGLQIGPDNSITIRGINSINSSTDPLILLDGTEINDLDAINPNDVYSVDVLKDASASIYGVRGANGVILITTKAAHHNTTSGKQKGRKK